MVTCAASHGLLQLENPECDARRMALYEYYHPLEFSPTIPTDEKRKLMEEWYDVDTVSPILGLVFTCSLLCFINVQVGEPTLSQRLHIFSVLC